MNVFGAFTFGSLIKTFVPGFVWLAALLILWNDAHYWIPACPALPDISTPEEANVLVLAIPIAILLGLVSNIIVFMGVNDRLVRQPLKKTDPALADLYTWLIDKLRAEHWESLGCTDARLKGSFMINADAELLILQTVGLQNLAYVREQYWYHLEFQINLLIAIFALLVALLVSPVVSQTAAPLMAWRAGAGIALLGGTCLLLLAAARKNYHRHIGKMCSLISATVYTKRTDAAAAKLKALSEILGSGAVI